MKIVRGEHEEERAIEGVPERGPIQIFCPLGKIYPTPCSECEAATPIGPLCRIDTDGRRKKQKPRKKDK